MNFLSINIRGMRVDGKAGWSRNLRKRYAVDFLGFQESQVSRLSFRDLVNFWGDGSLDFDVMDPHGRSGGIVNMWNPKVFKKLSSFKQRHFVVTTGSLVSDGTVLNVFNVYAPQRAGAKKRLWEDLAGHIRGCSGLIVLMGDFNAV